MGEILTFERFVPGAILGSHTERVDPAALTHWRALYPGDSGDGHHVPPGYATVLLMRAYMRALSPRPPGNVHARQRLSLHGRLRAGEAVTTVLRCADKTLRRDRRYVEVDARGHGEDGRPLYRGTMTLIWAA